MFADSVLASRLLPVCDRLVTGQHHHRKPSQKIRRVLPYYCRRRFSRVPEAEKLQNNKGISGFVALFLTEQVNDIIIRFTIIWRQVNCCIWSILLCSLLRIINFDISRFFNEFVNFNNY